ncbi:MAG: ferritin family protein [Syntrophobacteraceae bacterium]
MKANGSGLLELMCTAVEIKEKMKALYAGAAGKCGDPVGTETFEMLRDMEQKHLDRLNAIYADLAKGSSDLDACRFYDFEALGRSEVIHQLKQKRETISKACMDDVAAIESGMELENKGIEFFQARLKEAAEPIEREFLSHMLAEERSHYILLADLRFYYIDTEHWFMEKAKTGLDGA